MNICPCFQTSHDSSACPSPCGEAIVTMPTPPFIKLEEDGSIVSLEGILAVYATNESGSNWNKIRRIKVSWKDGNSLTFSYGSDDNYKDHNAKRRDLDLKQIEKALIPLLFMNNLDT
jgi:hypothetical protein